MHIFSIIFPLIFIVLCGYIASRSQFLERIHITGLSKFTFYISVPSFLFLNMAQADLKTSVSLNGFLSFYIPVILIYFFSLIIDRYTLNMNVTVYLLLAVVIQIPYWWACPLL